MKRFAVFGASGCGRGILPLVRRQLIESASGSWDLVFVDDSPTASVVNGHRALRCEQWLGEPAEARWVTTAIANSRVRQRPAERCQSDGVGFLDMRVSNVVLMDDIYVVPGAVVGNPARPMTSRTETPKE